MGTGENGSVTNAAILASLAIQPPRMISTPEWSQCPHIYIRQWRGNELSAYRSLFKGRESDDISDEDFLWHIFMLGACDAAGNAVVTDKDRAPIMDGPLAPLQRVVTATLDFNGLSERASNAALGN